MVCSTDAFTDTEIVFDVEDFNHFRLADDSGDFAHVVFGMTGVMDQRMIINKDDTNVGGWDACPLRSWLNETIFPELPPIWRRLIKPVQVRATEGGQSETVLTSVDRLFFRSMHEVAVLLDTAAYANECDPEAENVTFPIYSDNASREKRFQNGEGESIEFSGWVLRSPNLTYSKMFGHIVAAGRYSNINGSARNKFAMSWCFCI